MPGGARVADLAMASGVTPTTIRRDLEELEAQGIIRRTHGGVAAVPARGEHLPYSVRLDSYSTEKAALADIAASLIPDGSSVIVDDGSTCVAVARALTGRDLTVLALSIHVAAALGTRPGVRILTPGGALDPDELAWTGASAVDAVRRYRADIAILGICGWQPPDGPTAATLDDADLKRAVIAAASRTIAVTTPDKFERSATFAVCDLAEIDDLVTYDMDTTTAQALNQGENKPTITLAQP